MAHIAICIASYKRPEGLKALLDSFANLNLVNHGSIKVFIADNDHEKQEALNFVNHHRHEYPFDIVCAVEPQAGITYARNTSLRLLKEDGFPADYVAFTDDDIQVSQRWLVDLVHTAELYSADVVAGKCEPLFEIVPDAEILYSPFYHEHFTTPPTGTELSDFATNNLLLSIKILENEGYELFDNNLAISGGEDVDLAQRLLKKQYKLVKCSAAVAYETFPQERLTPQWVLQRYFRTGTTFGYIARTHWGRRKFFTLIVKKLIMLPVRFMKAKSNPTIKNECKWLHEKGFFHYLLKGTLFAEYKR